MQSFISAILGGLIVGALFLCFMPTGSDNLPTVRGDLPTQASTVEVSREPSTGREPADVLADRELAELRARVRKLEARANPSTSSAAHRTILQGQDTAKLSTRIRTLEDQVEVLRQSNPIAQFQPDCVDDPEQARSMIVGALWESERNQKGALGALNRIPLRLWLLERWPKHRGVHEQLDKLVHDYSQTFQHYKALEIVERFGPQAGLSNVQLDRLRLQGARSDVERVQIGRRLVQGATNPTTRAFDMLNLAECLGRLGQYDVALRMLDSALPAFANTKYAEHAAKRAKRLRQSAVKTR